MAPILKMENIVKRFGELVANDNITLQVEEGEIHSLLGENGAGKTTLMNVLYGLWQPDEGALYIRGQKMKLRSPRDAINQKIGMVSQHFSLVLPLTVSENIVLGDIPARNVLIDEKETRRRVLALAESCGFHIEAQAKVEELSVGEQQRVEILKALYQGAEILILDEPTAVLTSQETEELFKILRSMTSQGKSVIFITHKLMEALLTDRITILRDGKIVSEQDAKGATHAGLVEAMFGGKVTVREYKPIAAKDRSPVLEVKNLHVKDVRRLTRIKEISFNVLKGEIVGVAGVAGNGQKELIEAITGLRKVEEGSILFKGKEVTNYSPKARREMGMAHIPEERMKMGSFSDLAISENLILGREDKPPFIYRFLSNRFPFLNFLPIRSFAEKQVKKYNVITRGIDALARHLSGGNLQKMVLAREFAWEPELIIAAQPVRGLDAKTVEFVNERLVEQRENGKATLLVSYDLDEVLRLSDRVGVMFEGKMTMFPHDKINRSEIERLMVGGGGGEG
jgi:simple sugar transport system ATP-binding protein|tara:strand:- start:1766 stop:3298 length:1533 start_codon:yes stop_codon:yes gene_type:complete